MYSVEDTLMVQKKSKMRKHNLCSCLTLGNNRSRTMHSDNEERQPKEKVAVRLLSIRKSSQSFNWLMLIILFIMICRRNKITLFTYFFNPFLKLFPGNPKESEEPEETWRFWGRNRKKSNPEGTKPEEEVKTSKDAWIGTKNICWYEWFVCSRKNFKQKS